MNVNLIQISYLVASVLFIFGLKGLTHPRTAVRGNILGSIGMLLAVVTTLLDQNIITFRYILMGIVAGSLVGTVLAIRIQMTAMPQLVALFNAFGGGASFLVSGAALMEAAGLSTDPSFQLTISTAASGIIGAITFTGSIVAFGKLQGLIYENAVTYPMQHGMNVFLGIASLVLAVFVVVYPFEFSYFWWMIAASSILGTTLVLRIGGADMPVVISLLNSYSGLAAAAAGFVLNNNILIIAGSLVGASGLILTQIMCKAMNRSLLNVMFGAAQASSSSSSSKDDIYEGKIKSTTAEELAMIFESAQRVVIVPGYGLAVAQAQHPLRAFADLLEKRGTIVEYGIHPVAGRMPGHMNVLLAEADVPYDKLKEMDEINPSFPQTDVALIIGANDVVNPLAKTEPSSPIAGMPILNVDQARTVVVVKRSLSPGFAGVANPLFAMDHTLMFFADAKKAVQDLITAMKEV